MWKLPLFAALLLVLPVFVAAQGGADELCRDSGQMPSREIGRQGKLAQFVFGHIAVRGVEAGTPLPRVTVTYSDIVQPAIRQILTNSGNYCFRRLGASAMIVVEVDGVEVGRKSFSDLSDLRQREDFDIVAPNLQPKAVPGVVSTKFTREPNDKTTDLYKKAAAAESGKDLNAAVDRVKGIVAIDPQDFIAWAKLGSLYLSLDSRPEAEAAFKRSIAVRPDYTPVLLNYVTLLAVEKRIPEAIDILKRAVASDPASARAYRLLGEAFLQNRQGTMGLAALDEALRLDPVGMAECHLLKARLYDLAGAKNLAAAEYKMFLAKVPDYADKKTLEKYIRDNPEGPAKN
jgi:Tfp pilus assembly protein PilF